MMLELKEQVKAVKAASLAPEKKQLEVVARQHYKKVRSAVNSFSSEVRHIDDPIQKSVFQKKQLNYQEALKQADKDLKEALHPPKTKKADVSQEEVLMGEGGADGSGFTNANQVLDAGQRIQADALQSIARSERLVASAEDTGNETLQQLQKQSETIREVDEQLNTLGAQLDRAKKDVSWFARQIAGDKCFTMIFILVVFAIAGVVFWKLYDGRRTKAQQEAEAASTPVPEPPGPPPVLYHAYKYAAQRFRRE